MEVDKVKASSSGVGGEETRETQEARGERAADSAATGSEERGARHFLKVREAVATYAGVRVQQRKNRSDEILRFAEYVSQGLDCEQKAPRGKRWWNLQGRRLNQPNTLERGHRTPVR